MLFKHSIQYFISSVEFDSPIERTGTANLRRASKLEEAPLEGVHSVSPGEVMRWREMNRWTGEIKRGGM